MTVWRFSPSLFNLLTPLAGTVLGVGNDLQTIGTASRGSEYRAVRRNLEFHRGLAVLCCQRLTVFNQAIEKVELSMRANNRVGVQWDGELARVWLASRRPAADQFCAARRAGRRAARAAVGARGGRSRYDIRSGRSRWRAGWQSGRCAPRPMCGLRRSPRSPMARFWPPVRSMRSSNNQQDFVVARFNANGSLDTTFGVDGPDAGRTAGRLYQLRLHFSDRAEHCSGYYARRRRGGSLSLGTGRALRLQ